MFKSPVKSIPQRSLLTDAPLTGFIPSEEKPKPINWDEYGSLPSIVLWEGISLTCGLSPNSYIESSGLDVRFEGRMKIAIDHLRAGGLLHVVEQNIKHLQETRVTLLSVAILASGCAWELPEGFPKKLNSKGAPKDYDPAITISLFKELPRVLRRDKEAVAIAYSMLHSSLGRKPSPDEVFEHLGNKDPFTERNGDRLFWTTGKGKPTNLSQRGVGEWLSKYTN